MLSRWLLSGPIVNVCFVHHTPILSRFDFRVGVATGYSYHAIGRLASRWVARPHLASRPRAQLTAALPLPARWPRARYRSTGDRRRAEHPLPTLMLSPCICGTSAACSMPPCVEFDPRSGVAIVPIRHHMPFTCRSLSTDARPSRFCFRHRVWPIWLDFDQSGLACLCANLTTCARL